MSLSGVYTIFIILSFACPQRKGGKEKGTPRAMSPSTFWQLCKLALHPRGGELRTYKVDDPKKYSANRRPKGLSVPISFDILFKRTQILGGCSK
jgi:hypothetical protein